MEDTAIVLDGRGPAGADLLSLVGTGATTGPTTIASLTDEVAKRYELAILTVATLSEDPLAQSWMRSADTVLIAVRLGTTRMPDIERTLDLVVHLGGHPTLVADGRRGEGDVEFHYPAPAVTAKTVRDTRRS